MRYYIIIFMVAVMLIVNNSVFAGEFRNVNWGVNKKKILASEKQNPTYEDENTIVYSDNLSGINVSVVYIIDYGKLYRAMYQNDQKHMNLNDYIEDYNKFNVLLSKKYGSPYNDEVVWKNETFKNDVSNWGVAVGMGHLVLRTVWITDKSHIFNVLRGDDLVIKHTIIYSDKKNEHKFRNKDEKSAIDKL